MSQDITADVVVIGAGAIGASSAYQLAAAGHRVVLVEALDGPAAGSTGRSFASIRGQWADDLNVELSWRSIKTFRDFPDTHGIDVGYRPSGYLLLASEQQWAAQLAAVDLQRAHGDHRPQHHRRRHARPDQRVESDGERDAEDRIVLNPRRVQEVFDIGIDYANTYPGRRVISVDKASVYATSRLWRRTSLATAATTGLVIDNVNVDRAAYELVKYEQLPAVVITEGLFGDILRHRLRSPAHLHCADRRPSIPTAASAMALPPCSNPPTARHRTAPAAAAPTPPVPGWRWSTCSGGARTSPPSDYTPPCAPPSTASWTPAHRPARSAVGPYQVSAHVGWSYERGKCDCGCDSECSDDYGCRQRCVGGVDPHQRCGETAE